MRALVLGSGSKGNSTLILDEKTKLLIDVGFSYPKMKALLEKYNLTPYDIDGILITHMHKDHILGLSSFVKKNHTKVYVNKLIYDQLVEIIDEECLVLTLEEFAIGPFNITQFNTSHDSVGSVGFIVENNHKSLVYVTDTGYISHKNLELLMDKNAYIFESNHDIEMLMEGPYPYILKQRVLSDKGHLSNELAGEYLSQLIGINTKKVVLAHLSETNNRHEIAFNTIKDIIGDKFTNIELLVASQDESLDLGEVE